MSAEATMAPSTNADSSMEKTDTSEMDKAPKPSASGSYVTLAEYEGDKSAYTDTNVVLFFHAGWCPNCRATEENLNADLAGIPSDLTIVKVDFDNSDQLRQKYGVTTQHTFVQIDANGEQITKWSGAETAEDIAKQVV